MNSLGSPYIPAINRSALPGSEYSLISSRTKRSESSASPKKNRASVRASSVLPTPVGPVKSNTPSGRPGSFKPALKVSTELVAARHASAWPITSVSKKILTSSSSSDTSSRRKISGNPVSFTNSPMIWSLPISFNWFVFASSYKREVKFTVLPGKPS